MKVTSDQYRLLGNRLQRVCALRSLPNLSGSAVLVTGGTEGVGKALVQQLVGAGAEVLLTARDLAKGQRVGHEIAAAQPGASLHIVELDLADMASIRQGSARIRELCDRLPLLICNAGMMAPTVREETVDGFEVTFGVNYLGHALLISELEDCLCAAAPSTVVIVASEAHRRAGGGLDIEDLMFERTPYRRRWAYGRSKTANILQAQGLASRLGPRGVRAIAVHPGVVDTPLVRSMFAGPIASLAFQTLRRLVLIDPRDAAEGILRTALDPDLAPITGEYFELGRRHSARPYATDPELVRRLEGVTQTLIAGIE